MALKDEFLDYEPLHRKKPPRDFTEDAPFRQTTPPPVREEKSKPVSEKPVSETWIHKHGHSISFAGVFLFTTLVFFRPYELSPSLKFLSNVAFWIALATLLVFVITQLGLENTITVRTREVKLVFLLALVGAISIPQALAPQKAFNAFYEFVKVVLISS